ncbi:MAG: glycosyltransferase family 39 protein [Anaerolineae bacterium]|nr:glycosyltransferase family 39 protein [Anaerolineae bacterium]
MSPRLYKVSLTGAFIGFVVLAVIYSALLPPFEYADGPRHLAYMQWLAAGNGFPPQGEAAWATPIKQEAGQPPLYYLVGAVPIYLLTRADPQAVADNPLVFRPNPTYFGPAPRDYPDNDNIGLHYASDMRPLRGEYLLLYAARGVTLLFGLFLLAAVYWLAREIYPQQHEVALAAVWLVAFIPQVIYISSVASNDIPAAALSALALGMLARTLRQGSTFGRSIILGVFVGLALLTKISAVVIIPGVIVGYGWLWLRSAGHRVHVGANALLAGLVAFAISGWWFIRAWRLYGSPLGLTAHDNAPWAFTETFVRPPLARQWRDVFESFWASFGWGPVEFPDWVYGLLALLALAAVAGLIAAVIRWWRRHAHGIHYAAFLAEFRPILFVIFVVVLAFSAAALENWMRRVSAEFGRLLYPALGGAALLLITGWRVWHTRLVWVVNVIMLVLAVLTPVVILQPTYHPQPLSEREVAALPPSLGWRFGDVAELIAVTPLQTSVDADALLPVEVCWRVLDSAEDNYLVFLHLVGPDNAVVANRYTVPGLGTYPTATWQPGDIFCDRVVVRTWDNVTRTLVYKLEAGLITEDLSERLPAFTVDGTPLADTFVGNVRLVARIDIGNAAEIPPVPLNLVAADLPPVWQAGETVATTLQWQLGNSVAQDYQVYVHVRSLENDEIVAQSDGPPVAGWYGTSWWQAGEVVADTRLIDVPETIAPGSYAVYAGLYELATGVRYGDEQHVGVIEISAP